MYLTVEEADGETFEIVIEKGDVMTYKDLLSRINSGNIELNFRAERMFKKLSPESSESDVDRFIRSNHIEVKEEPEDLKAFKAYNFHHQALVDFVGAITDDSNTDLFQLSKDIVLNKSFELDEKAIGIIREHQEKLDELRPLARKWAAFTNSKLPTWNRWDV